MTRSCPLPVDWLDYLDGEREPELAEHLAGCRSCQVLVASLQAEIPTTVPADWSEAFTGRTDAVWHEDRPANPAPAEFWFSAADFDLDQVVVGAVGSGKTSSFAYHALDRVLVLVLSHPDEDHVGWLDVVPVLSDVEGATDTDFLFSSEENTLGAPWRALFAHQLKVARRQLDTRVGSLSELGASTLFAALAGDADEARWGVPLQHFDDPRARLDDQLEEALKRLRTPWLVLHDADDRDEQGGADNPGLHLVAPPSAPAPELSDESEPAGVFWLAPVSEPLHEFALAAASAPTAKKDFWAVEQEALKLVGKLDVDWQRGLLIFVISAASLHEQARRVRLHVRAAGKEYASEPFVPTEDTTVPLAEGLTKDAVDKLGAEVVP
jgi:hypothetical protein